MSYRYPEKPDDRQKEQGEEHFRKKLQEWMQGSIVGKTAPAYPHWLKGSLIQEITGVSIQTGRRWNEDEIQILLDWHKIDLAKVQGDDSALKRCLSERDALKVQLIPARNTDIADLRKRLAELERETEDEE